MKTTKNERNISLSPLSSWKQVLFTRKVDVGRSGPTAGLNRGRLVEEGGLKYCLISTAHELARPPPPTIRDGLLCSLWERAKKPFHEGVSSRNKSNARTPHAL